MDDVTTENVFLLTPPESVLSAVHVLQIKLCYPAVQERPALHHRKD